MSDFFTDELVGAPTNTRLPYKRRLAYLESTGTQWIDTLVYANDMRKIEIGAQINSFYPAYTSGIIGANNNGSRTKGIGASSSTRFFVATFAGNAYITVTSVSDAIHLITADFVSQVASFDGDDFAIEGAGSGFSATVPVCLFGISVGTTGTTRTTSGRVSYCKLYDANIALVRDFIPVLDWNNVPCMYDKVSGAFFYNSGSGNFNYGEL